MKVFENDWLWIEIENAEIPWLKIFTQCGSREFSHCSEATRKEVWRVLDLVEREMLSFYKPEKINMASFANYLPRVHWHIMARFKNDAYFPEPVWGKKQRDAVVSWLPIEDFVDELVKKLET